MTKQDIFRPFHWPSSDDPQFLVEPNDENCPAAWNVFANGDDPGVEIIGQVVKEGTRYQAWGRVWEPMMNALVPLWFPGSLPGVLDGPDTTTMELAVERVVQSWQQYTD